MPWTTDNAEPAEALIRRRNPIENPCVQTQRISVLCEIVRREKRGFETLVDEH